MIGIYKIISPSGRIYVGQSIDLKRRFFDYNRLSNCKSQTRLYNSFIKYGVENHVFEIIEITQAYNLNERERYYQELYSCISKKGLNCKYVSTNLKSGVVSEFTKNKLSLVKKGFKHTDESKKLVSINNSRYWKGKKRPPMSEEQKNKISKSNFGKKRDKETGFKISEKISKILVSDMGIFYTYKEASLVYNIKETTLKAMINGQNKNKTNLILTLKS